MAIDEIIDTNTDVPYSANGFPRNGEGMRNVCLSNIIMFSLLVFSSFAQATDALQADVDEEQFPLVIDGLPPLMCDEEICPLKDRLFNEIPDDVILPVEENSWWFSYGPDRDSNGMDDRLQRIIASEYESQSPTSIIGSDGRLTVAIIVDYAWHPSENEVTQLNKVLSKHNWVGTEGGAWFQILESIDSIVVDKVPVSALLDIWKLPGVVVLEQQNVMVPFLDVSVPSMHVSSGPTSSPSAHQMDPPLRGDDVVIAILDTGVDNEHRSLNDFDDVDDEPDSDAFSYSDHKFVCGFDATAVAGSNPNECDDPDDGAGHGTHVAGTALGTGSSNRQHVGVAPGAYLVDVKVLTDVGGTNSQTSINGLQWVINNRDTDWDGNQSGIDIASMSLGSVSSPNSDDTGDNGSSAEARLVNNASSNGIVMVCAMGNDGRQRVPSPASADACISVAAIDDKNSIDRADDSIADYSNWGPRDDDLDDDELDELKPDVSAPGSDIIAPQHASGSNPIIDSPADNDYTEMSGTSMATPHVSGLIALMLQDSPNLDPEEIKELLQSKSEVMGSPYDSSIDPIWNEKYGYGMVDAALLFDLDSSGGGGNPSDPEEPVNPNGWFLFQNPGTGSYFTSGLSSAIRGNLTDKAPEGTDSIEYTLYYTSCEDGCLKQVEGQTGMVNINDDNEFFITVEIPENLHELPDFHLGWHWDSYELKIVTRAYDSGNNIYGENISRWFNLGWYDIALETPTGISSVNGDVEVTGTRSGYQNHELQYRVGNSEWKTSLEFDSADYQDEDEEWTWYWNTLEEENGERITPDGQYSFAVRIVGENDYVTKEIRRDIVVDNDPPAAELEMGQSLSFTINGLLRDQAFVNSDIGVIGVMRNIGDRIAEDVPIELRVDGALKYELTVARIEPGSSVEVVMYWMPTESGTPTIEIIIDPANTLSNEDNVYGNIVSSTYTILDRPNGVDLNLIDGIVQTSPDMPRANEEFELMIPVENIGSETATSVQFTVEVETELGWLEYSNFTESIIVGGGITNVPVSLISNDSSILHVRVKATPALDLDWDNNEQTYSIPMVNATLGASRTISNLGDTEIALDFVLTGSEGHLISVDDQSIRIHRVSPQLNIQTCRVDFEERWAGSIATTTVGDGLTHVVWTGQKLDDFGFYRTHLLYTTIDESCQSPPNIDLMEPLLSSEGTYFGIDIDVLDDTVAIAGYYRDIFASGAYTDTTSVFTIHSTSSFDNSSWILSNPVISNVMIDHSSVAPVDIEIGEEYTHLLYTHSETLPSGSIIDAIWYAHGDIGNKNWLFRTDIVEDGANPTMLVTSETGEDRIFTAWTIGNGYSMELILSEFDPSLGEQNQTSISTPGISHVSLVEMNEKVLVIMDAVGTNNQPMVGLGVFDENIGIGIRLSPGRLIDAQYSEENEELVVLIEVLGQVRLRPLVFDQSLEQTSGNPFDWIRVMLGVDENTWRTISLLGGVACIAANILLGLILVVRRRRSSRTKVKVALVSVDEYDDDGIEMLPDVPIVVSTHEDELEEIESEVPTFIEPENEPVEELKDTEEPQNSRQERRRKRQQAQALKEIGDLPLPPPPGSPELGDLPPPPGSPELGDLPPPPGSPELGDLPPPPTPSSLGMMDREVSCPSCSAVFTLRDPSLTSITCPVCDVKFEV